jgi:hypothetical protein
VEHITARLHRLHGRQAITDTCAGWIAGSDRRQVMKTLRHFAAAAVILAAMAVPGAAKSVSDEIGDQVSQTTPHRP